MPTALRLVVMWMVGALAIAVAWCLHAQDQPPVVNLIPPAPAPMPRLAAPVVDESRAAIVKHVRERYDGVYMRYANAPLVEIGNSTLRRFFPDTRFFATKLEPGLRAGLVYRRNDLLVSFRRAPSQDEDIRSWLVDASDNSAHTFLSQFLGVSASTFLERCEVALGLARLLAAAATEGVIARSSPRCFEDTSVEVWRPWLGREHWRDIFVFSANDRVSRIAIR